MQLQQHLWDDKQKDTSLKKEKLIWNAIIGKFQLKIISLTGWHSYF